LAGLAVSLGTFVAWDPALAAVIVLTMFWALLAWWRPAAAIAAIAFYIPIERAVTVRLPEVAFIISQLSGEIVLAFLLGGVVVRRAAKKEPFVSTPVDIAILGFVLACALSAVVNDVPAKSAAYGVRIVLRYVMVYYAIINGGFTRRQVRMFIKIFFAAVAVQIAVGLLETVTGGTAKEWFIASRNVSVAGVEFVRGLDRGTGRGLFTVIFGTLEHYNNYGHFMSMALVFGLAITRFRGRLLGGKALRTMLLLILLCIVLSFSRSSLLIATLGSAVVFIASGSRRLGIAILVLLAIGLAAIVLVAPRYSGERVPVYSTNLLYRWVRPFTPERMTLSDAGNYRLFLLLVVSVRAVSQSPFFGFGPGTFGSALTKTNAPELYERLGMNYEYAGMFAADSNWTTIIAQTGLFGLLAFSLVIFGLAAFCYRAMRKSSDRALKAICLGQLAVTTAIVLAAFFSSAFENRFTAYYFWAVSGMAVSLARAHGVPSGRGRLRRLFRGGRGSMRCAGSEPGRRIQSTRPPRSW